MQSDPEAARAERGHRIQEHRRAAAGWADTAPSPGWEPKGSVPSSVPAFLKVSRLQLKFHPGNEAANQYPIPSAPAQKSVLGVLGVGASR